MCTSCMYIAYRLYVWEAALNDTKCATKCQYNVKENILQRFPHHISLPPTPPPPLFICVMFGDLLTGPITELTTSS